MNDTNIACFLSCCRTKSLTYTANDLDMTHQAVSKNIQKLEDEIGYKLFIRDGQRFRITEAGQLFREWLMETDRRMEWASHYFNNQATLQTPSLRISYSTWLGVPPCAKRSTEDFLPGKNVQIDWQTGSSEFAIQQVLDRKSDIAIIPEQLSYRPEPNLFRCVLPQSAELKMLYPEEFLCFDNSIDYPALFSLPLLLCDCGPVLNQQMERLYRSLCIYHGCSPLPISFAPNFFSTISESIYGNAITFISNDAVPLGELSPHLLTESLTDFPEAFIPMVCLYHLTHDQNSVLKYVGRSCDL